MTPTLTTVNRYMHTLFYLCVCSGLIAVGVFLHKSFLEKSEPSGSSFAPTFSTDYRDHTSCLYRMDRCESLPGLATYYAWPYGFSFMFPSDITIAQTSLINDRLLALTYHCPETTPCGNTELFVEATSKTSLSTQTIASLYLNKGVTVVETASFTIDGKQAQRVFVLQEDSLIPDTVIQILNGPHLVSFIAKGACGFRNCLPRARELSAIFLSSIEF